MGHESVLQKLRDHWDQLAREDARGHGCPGQGGATDEDFARSGAEFVRAVVEPELMELAAPASEAVALEVGCGPGRILRPLATHFGEVHGVDISREMVGVAKEFVAGAENVTVHLGDGMTLQCVRRLQFDFVLSYDTLSHLPDRRLLEYLLRQCRQRLKPDGLCKLQLDPATISDEEVAQTMERAGLAIQKSQRDDMNLWIWSRRP